MADFWGTRLLLIEEWERLWKTGCPSFPYLFCLDRTVNDSKWIDASSRWCCLVGARNINMLYVNHLPLASVNIHGYRDPDFPVVHMKILLLGWRGTQ